MAPAGWRSVSRNGESATVGVDVDGALLARAREKAPALAWVEADLARLAPDDAPGPFDAVVMAGNVMIFVAPGTEAAVVANLACRLAPGGLLVAGFQLSRGRLTARALRGLYRRRRLGTRGPIRDLGRRALRGRW